MTCFVAGLQGQDEFCNTDGEGLCALDWLGCIDGYEEECTSDTDASCEEGYICCCVALLTSRQYQIQNLLVVPLVEVSDTSPSSFSLKQFLLDILHNSPLLLPAF